MKTIGFKPKHMTSIFSLLVAILLLSNLQFVEGDARDVPAYVTNMPVLNHISSLLGITPCSRASVPVSSSPPLTQLSPTPSFRHVMLASHTTSTLHGGNGNAPVFGLEMNMNRHCKSSSEAMENRMKVRGYRYNRCRLY
jgi:hypothetical protein